MINASAMAAELFDKINKEYGITDITSLTDEKSDEWHDTLITNVMEAVNKVRYNDKLEFAKKTDPKTLVSVLSEVGETDSMAAFLTEVLFQSVMDHI